MSFSAEISNSTWKLPFFGIGSRIGNGVCQQTEQEAKFLFSALRARMRNRLTTITGLNECIREVIMCIINNYL